MKLGWFIYCWCFGVFLPENEEKLWLEEEFPKLILDPKDEIFLSNEMGNVVFLYEDSGE